MGSLAANPYGLHDVLGNVAEWCLDWYCPYGVRARKSDGLRLLQGESPAERRVVRGGSFAGVADDLRLALRTSQVPAYRSNQVGIRPARNVHE